jgi:hypothetical protein
MMLIVASLLLAGAATARAGAAAPGEDEPVTVRAEVSADRTYIGDPVLLRIVVDGSSAPQPPVLPEMPGLVAEFLGGHDASSHSVFIVNGRRTEQSSRRYIFQYRLTPTRGGVLKVPAIGVVVGGRTLTTAPLTVAALEPRQTDDFRLTLSLAKKEAYVGEPVRATITWFISKNVRNHSFTLPTGGAIDVYAAPDPRPAGGAGGQDSPYVEVPFPEGAAVGVKGMAEVDGRTFLTLTIERILVPREAGTATVGPARAAFDAVVGQRRASFFDSPFDDRAITERTVIASEAATLTVKALPAEGRPADFTGLVGSYSVEASASPTSVSVGDPITLTVTVRGPDPMGLVQPLAPSQQRDLAAAFKWPSETVFPRTGPGTAQFTYTIRPRSDRVTEIPPVRVPYFDTAAREYRVAASGAIPLTVRPAAQATVGLPEAEPAAEESRPGGIAPIRRQVPMAREDVGLGDAAASPGWLAAVAGPPVVYLAAAGAAALRRRAMRDPLARRRRMAHRRAARALAQASRLPEDLVAAAVSAAVRRCVADLSGRPESGLTAEECVALVEPADAGAARRLGALLKECESARFAPGGARATGAGLIDAARRLLADVPAIVPGAGKEAA